LPPILSTPVSNRITVTVTVTVRQEGLKWGEARSLKKSFS
jgi:hypothetical protein